MCVLRLEKVYVVEDLVDPLLGQRIELPDQPLSQNVVHFSLLLAALAAPAGARAASVDVHISGPGVSAGVDPQPTYELRVFEFHDLHRKPHHPAVDGGVPAVAVRVHRDVCGITVLMLAVERGSRNAAVVRRRTKPRMDVKCQTDRNGRAVPPCDLGDDELELVQKPRVDCRVPRPGLLPVVTQKVADSKMLADRQIDIALVDLEESCRGLLLPGDLLRQ